MTPSKLRILVVDDMELSRKEISRILANLGYLNVEMGSDGLKALQHLKQGVESGQLFKLIICDWNMPHFSGLEVLKACRQDPVFMTPAFIMVTAEAGLTSVVEALNAGADDYIIKPVVATILQKKIARVVTRLGV